MYLIPRRIANFALLIYLIVLMQACTSLNITSVNTPTPMVTATPPGWFLRWLEGPICSPPCWETITPGVTSANDTYKIQQQYPQLQVVTKKGDPTILQIDLHLAYDNVPAKLVVEKYGQPDYVRLYKCDPGANCETHIIYEKLGMVLNFYLPDTNKQRDWTVEVTPESNILEIYFIEAGLDKYWYNFSGDPKKMDKWIGYGAYSN